MSRATHVPVGQDQQQHLEFARECATNFNHAYGPHLVPPQTVICKQCESQLDEAYIDVTSTCTPPNVFE